MRGCSARLMKSLAGRDFCGRAGPPAEPVRDIFAPAGRSRSTPNTNGITAAPTGDALLKTGNVARKATAPTVRRRPDTLTGGARA